MLGEEVALESGTVVVGLTLAGGQLPTGQLRPGDSVRIIFTAPVDAEPADVIAEGGAVGGTADLGNGTVFEVGETDTSGLYVSLTVEDGQAGLIASAERADQVSLALVPAGG